MATCRASANTYPAKDTCQVSSKDPVSARVGKKETSKTRWIPAAVSLRLVYDSTTLRYPVGPTERAGGRRCIRPVLLPRCCGYIAKI